MADKTAAEAIQPRLSTFDTAMVVFSLVVGIGIFRTPATVAGAAQSTPLFFLAWAVGGAVSLLGALVFAEIGSRHPRAGGYYRVVADCYHPTLAFMLNWSQTLMQGAGAAGVAFIGADYLMPVLLPASWQNAPVSITVACSLMLFLLVMNYCGIRPGARTQNWLSVIKIVTIVALGLLALILTSHHTHPEPAITAPLGSRLTSALIPCFYAYGGYHLTMNLGGDLKDAQKRFPRAITAGVVMVVGLYLLLNLAYERVLGVAGIADSRLVAAVLARATFGPYGETVIALLVFLSAAGFVNATVLQMPRSIYAMAQDEVLPRSFLRVNPATQVPEIALLFFGLTMLVPAFLLGSFDKLLDYVIFIDMVTLTIVASTIFVLRRRPGTGGYSMPGYPVLPVIYILCLIAVAARDFSQEPALSITGIAILLTGWPLFTLGHRLFHRPKEPSRP